MLVVWQTAARFDSKRSLCAWLLGIAHRKALKAFAGSARRSGRELGIDPDWEPSDETQDLERDALETDLRRVIGQALQDLSPEYRAAIELCFYEGFSYEDVAGVLGCATNTVKTRMFRARRQLARALADLGPNHLRP